MAKYFTLKEMTYSDTAKKYGIDNTPSASITANLNELMAFLDGLREAWGSPIKVTSGYRSVAVNLLVGGSPTSVHVKGHAADLRPVNGKMKEFKKFCVEYVKDKEFDQLLLEKSRTTEWVHIGLKNRAGKQRKQIKNMNV